MFIPLVLRHHGPGSGLEGTPNLLAGNWGAVDAVLTRLVLLEGLLPLGLVGAVGLVADEPGDTDVVLGRLVLLQVLKGVELFLAAVDAAGKLADAVLGRLVLLKIPLGVERLLAAVDVAGVIAPIEVQDPNLRLVGARHALGHASRFHLLRSVS